MNKNQKIVCDWFINNGMDFLSAIVELEGVYESIPNEVAEAFSELTDKEIMEEKPKHDPPIKLGKETYGTKNIEVAFKEALEPYFKLDTSICVKRNTLK